jgi:hypothetical protein
MQERENKGVECAVLGTTVRRVTHPLRKPKPQRVGHPGGFYCFKDGPPARRMGHPAIALNYFAYNFIKIHRTLRVSPAMAAGVTDHLWDAGELVSLLEAEELAKRAA